MLGNKGSEHNSEYLSGFVYKTKYLFCIDSSIAKAVKYSSSVSPMSYKLKCTRFRYSQVIGVFK